MLVMDPATATSGAIDAAALIADHQTSIWWYVRMLGADPALADDLVQETFLAVLRANVEMREPKALNAYLRKSARSIWIRHAERAQRQPTAADDLEALEAAWARFHPDGGDGSDVVDALRDCLGDLAQSDGRAHEAIRRHYEVGESGEEVAAALGVAHTHLRVIVHRAKAVLRACVEQALGVPGSDSGDQQQGASS